MRRILLLVMCCVFAVSSFAQKTRTVSKTTAHTESTYQFTQARKPQVWVEPLVKPLVVEVEVIKEAPTFWKTTLGRYKVETELEGNLENVHNYGIFLYTKETNADMILAATYNFYTNPNRTSDDDWYIIEIKGFPAKFNNWRTADQSDYEWIRMQTLTGNKQKVYEKVKE